MPYLIGIYMNYIVIQTDKTIDIVIDLKYMLVTVLAAVLFYV